LREPRRVGFDLLLIAEVIHSGFWQHHVEQLPLWIEPMPLGADEMFVIAADGFYVPRR